MNFAQIIVIIVIVFIIIFLCHTLSIKKTKGHSGRVVVHGTHRVTIDSKSQENRFYGIGSDKAFYLNDIEAPTLYLDRGFYYEFVNESDEPLYFTTSDEGGSDTPGCLAKNIKGGFKGLANGTIFLKVTDDLPATFYYQSGKSKNMGSVIVVV